MATVYRVQYAQKISDNYNERKIYHLETDSAVVLMSDGRTLEEFAKQIDGERKFTLSGGVTGTVKMDGHSDVVINTDVTDDGHRHTGATLDLGEATRVVVTADDKSVVTSKITVEELNALKGVTSNIQDQLDEKVKESENNGNLLVDGAELNVYTHPTKEGLTANPIEGLETDLFTRDKIINGLLGVTVDGEGHLESLELKQYKMPAYSQFFLTSEEPTDSVAGDFWLETLSVEVGFGEYYMENTDGDLGKTSTVGKNSESRFSMIDLMDETNVTPAGSMDQFIMTDI